MPQGNPSPRNPSWTTDELILALDLYLSNPLFPPAKTSKEIVELSRLLNQLGKYLPKVKSATYRNPNGVHMKLMHFRSLDPEYTNHGIKGLQRGGKEDEVIWSQFAKDPDKCGRIARAIRQAIQLGKAARFLEEHLDSHEEDAVEGRILTGIHKHMERNRTLVEKRKKQFLNKHRRLFCEACGFDFEKRYGKRGGGFIECHHTRPLHELKPNTRANPDEMAMLCCNCHRMVHAQKQWLTLEALKKSLRD